MMRTLVPGTESILERPYSLHKGRGFTLIELLVVLVIVGVALGAVVFKITPDDRQILKEEASRIALLLQTARDEAVLRNRPIAFEAEPDRYRFLIRENNQWQILTGDEILRERAFRRPPVQFSITPAFVSDSGALRIVFGREPVDKPFVLTLIADRARIVIRADGIGHFEVE